MTTSKRRLVRSPAKRRSSVSGLAELERAYLGHHIARSSSPKTISHYEGTFDIFRDFLEATKRPADASALTTAAIGDFAIWLKETPPSKKWRGQAERSIVTIHGHLKDLRAFVRWLAEEEMIETVPRIYLPKLPQTLFPILSQQDLIKIFQTQQLATDTEIGKRNRALFSFMLDSAVRLSEVAGLNYQDLYLSDGAAKIWGKGSRERLVFFSQNTADAIRLWLSVRGKEPGSLFWLEPSGIRMMIDRVQKEAGLEVFHAHQIRHTALTMMMRKRMNPHEVKRIAGHSNILVTERYLSLSDEDLKNAHTSASPVDQVVVQLEPERTKRRRWGNRQSA